MQLAGVFATFVLAGLAGCTNAAAQRDQFRSSDRRLPFDQKLRFEMAAPIIVLGHVLEVSEIGQPQRSRTDGRIKIQLARIKIEVEEMIKGNVGSSPMEFYYFVFSADASEVDLGVPRYLPDVGQRRIYFLKPSSGSYRSVGDVYDYTLQVSSGSHSRGFCKGKSPGCCIAEILLVPQQDYDASWFVAHLVESQRAAEVMCSRRAALDLIRNLTQHPDQRISDGAREVLAIERSSQ